MKTIRVIEWPNGFVNPIKVRPGPGGGAFLLQELVHMVPPADLDEVELVVYEIKATRTIKAKDLVKGEVT